MVLCIIDVISRVLFYWC